MPQPQRRTHAERTDLSDRRMLDAAIRLIVERGTDRTTLKEVGELAGYSRGLAGYRFGSKAGLFEFVLRAVGERWLADLTQATNGRRGYRALCAALDAHCAMCLDAPDPIRAFYILWFESIGASSPVKNVIAGIHQRRQRDVAGWLAGERFAAGLDRDAVAGQFTAAVLGIAFHWLLHPDDADGIRRLHLDLKNTLGQCLLPVSAPSSANLDASS